MKPGDVQIAMSGKSIEIINTDAEGRLVLADGLAYARQLGATHLIDAATLTGACVVALGMVNAGCFANDEETYRHFTGATEISGERFWRLPLRRRVQGTDQFQHRRHHEHGRQPLGRSHYCGDVSQGICGRHALDSPGYCGRGLDRKSRSPGWQRVHPELRCAPSPSGCAATRNRASDTVKVPDANYCAVTRRRPSLAVSPACVSLEPAFRDRFPG